MASITGSVTSLFVSVGSLSGEAAEVVTWIRYRLGEPTLPVELQNEQVVANFEEAQIEFSAILNSWRTRDHISSLLGISRNADIADLLPTPVYNTIARMCQMYGTEAGAGGNVDWKKGYVDLTTQSQDYNLLTTLKDSSGTVVGASLTAGQFIDIREVWHYSPAPMLRYYDPYSSYGFYEREFGMESFQAESTFYVLPIWHDILRGMQIKLSDKVRRSNYSYNIIGNILTLYPIPKASIQLWVKYTIGPISPFDASATGLIKHYADVPYNFLDYADLNVQSKRWVRQYTLGLSMETLGYVRGKFGSIPIPNGDVSLNSDTLISNGIEKQKELKEELNKMFEDLQSPQVLKREVEKAEALETVNSRVPLKIYIM